MTGWAAELERDTIAGIVESVLEEHMSLGTSGRYIADFKVTPSDLAENIADRLTSGGAS